MKHKYLSKVLNNASAYYHLITESWHPVSMLQLQLVDFQDIRAIGSPKTVSIFSWHSPEHRHILARPPPHDTMSESGHWTARGDMDTRGVKSVYITSCKDLDTSDYWGVKWTGQSGAHFSQNDGSHGLSSLNNTSLQ